MKQAIVFVFVMSLHFSLTAKEHPVELGFVKWSRDYDEALVQAKEQQKPVFILFQEVPGCSTCRNYGKNVLSHPLIVEALETEFVPLAIFNNKGGNDRKVLELYNEPTWNNPVARIVNAEGSDIVNRISGNYSKLAVVDAMLEAMTKNNRIAPRYLTLLRDELSGQNNEKEANLAMYCFWTGEKEIADIPGVISTEAGFMDHREVVKVKYDAEKTDLDKIVKSAKKASCADAVYVDNPKKGQKKSSSYRKDHETKYYLYNSTYKYLPMTDMQALRVNRELGNRSGSADEWLSPRQLALLTKIKSDKNLRKESRFDQELSSAWFSIVQRT